jgi:threonylcarbamoyladenosine tRNA methylthiotransferase MtaB
VAVVERLKTARPEIAIGADLIAGFPTESEEMFRNTLALIDECDVVQAHIFPYSPREGTPAARMPQIEPEVRKRRAALLREAGAVRRAAWLRTLVGSVQTVLVERPGDRGHAGNFAEVRFAAQEVGSARDVRIDGTDGKTLTATPLPCHSRESGNPTPADALIPGQEMGPRFRGSDTFTTMDSHEMTA